MVDELEKAIEDTKTAYDEWEYLKDCGEDWSSEHRSLKMALDALQTVKQNRWIPCSERLPKDNKTKIVQIKGINEVEAGYYSNGDWWCISSAGTISILEVVAWMELPEPYRGEE